MQSAKVPSSPGPQLSKINAILNITRDLRPNAPLPSEIRTHELDLNRSSAPERDDGLHHERDAERLAARLWDLPMER